MALSNYTPHYTFDDYLQWEGDWELWSGFPIAICPSPGMTHQILSGRVYRKLCEALEIAGCRDCVVVPDCDWKVANDTVFRPDVSVACKHPLEAFLTKTPAMVVEILSDSTRQRDTLYKREMYEKLGVRTYLVVEPKNSSYLLLKRQGEVFIASDSMDIGLSEDCDVRLDLSGLFDDLV